MVLGFVQRFLLLAANIVALASAVVQFGSDLAGAAQTLFDVGRSLWDDFRSYVVATPRTTLMLIGLVLASFILLPYGVSNSSEIIETWNVLAACIWRPITEFISRAIVTPYAEFYAWFSEFFNLWWFFVRDTAVEQVVAGVSTVECVLKGGSVTQLFQLPTNVWTILMALLWGTIFEPRATRVEPMVAGEFGYHHPTVNLPGPRDGRFGHNPLYGAQGPASVPSTYFSLKFFAQNVWEQWLVVIDETGHLVTFLVSALGNPGQRLVKSLTVLPSQEESAWRRLGDISCRVVELAAFTSVYSFSDPLNPVQDAREALTGFWCPIARQVVGFGRPISIILIHATTRNLPTPEVAGTCDPGAQNPSYGPPNPDPVSFFRGVPFVDLFLPNGNTNILLFSQNIVFCRYQRSQPNKACGGLVSGSYSFIGFPSLLECPEWDGTSTPLITERINYLGLFIDQTATVLTLFFDQEALDDTNLNSGPIQQIAEIFKAIIGLLVDGLIFTLNTFFGPNCSTGQALSTWFGEELGRVAILTLEFIFQDSCSLAIDPVESEDNIFLCLVALASRAAPTTFLGNLCDIVDKIPFTGLDLSCGTDRKRSTAEFAQFETDAPPQQATLTYSQSMRIYSAFYAFETRAAIGAFDECVFNEQTSRLSAPHCESECSVRPCVDAALECIDAHLGADRATEKNYWRGAAQRSSYWASAARGVALFADTFVGCRDGDAARFADALNATAAMAQSAAMRAAFAAQELGTAHARCSSSADGDSAAYRACIGLTRDASLDDPADMSPLEQSRAALAAHGVYNHSSPCAATLYRFGVGVLADDIGAETANAEHERFRACSTLLAYGATARARGSTNVPLADFLDEWRAALAMTASTELFTDPMLRKAVNASHAMSSGVALFGRTDSTWIDSLLGGGRALVDSQYQFELAHDTGNGSRSTRHAMRDRRHKHDPIEVAHNVVSSAYAYFNYLARFLRAGAHCADRRRD